MTLPHVFIAVPTYDGKRYCIARFIDNLGKLSYSNKEIVFCDNSKTAEFQKYIISKGYKCLRNNVWDDRARFRIAESQNRLLDEFLRSNAEYFMFIESDVFVPENCIERLIAHNKQVIGGWYYIKQKHKNCKDPDCLIEMPCLSRPFGKFDINSETFEQWMLNNPLAKVFLGAMGFVLIRRDVFEKHGIRFKVMNRVMVFSDTFFYRALGHKGIAAYVDTRLLAQHFQGNWAGIQK